MIIDTHCHIDLYPNPNLVIKELEKQNIITIGMTNLPSHFNMGFRHTRNLRKVRLALGMHPLMALNHSSEFPEFYRSLKLTSYIGEIGLDFSREGIETKDIQIDSFNKILEAVSKEKKILSIHSRNAEKKVLEMLRKYKIQNAIFHWYSGGLKLIDEIVDSGYFFSFNTAMVKSEKGKKIIARVPKEKMLTETDGPFIKHNGRIVKSMDLKAVISFLNDIEETKEMEEQISQNFMKLVAKIK